MFAFDWSTIFFIVYINYMKEATVHPCITHYRGSVLLYSLVALLRIFYWIFAWMTK